MNSFGPITDTGPLRNSGSFTEAEGITAIRTATEPGKGVLESAQEGFEIPSRTPLETFENRIPREPENEEELARYEITDASSVSITYRWFPTELWHGEVPVPHEGLPVMAESVEMDFIFASGESSAYTWQYKEVRLPDDAGNLRLEGVYLRHQAESTHPVVSHILSASAGEDPNTALERLNRRLQILEEAVSSCPDIYKGERLVHEGIRFEGKNEELLGNEIRFLRQCVKKWLFPVSGFHPVIPDWMGVAEDFHQFTMNLDLLCSAFRVYREFLIRGPVKIGFQTDLPLPGVTGDADRVLTMPEQILDLRQIAAETWEKALSTVQFVYMVRGYADSRGTTAHNLELSRARAEWVSNFLGSSCQVPKRSIFLGWYGDAYARKDHPKAVDDPDHRVVIIEIALCS